MAELMSEQVAGAVLAGGLSRRFGSDKAMFKVEQATMLERSIHSLRGAGCTPIFVVGGDEESRSLVETRYLPDLWPGDGPLGAIITALEALSSGWLVILSCDVPAIGVSEVQALLEACSNGVEVVLAKSERGLEPLVAVYSHLVKDRLRLKFEDGCRSVLRALDDVSCTEIRLKSAVLLNVNRPEDLLSW